MPRLEYVIRVFVSSPSDLAEERAILESLVTELNDTWSQNLGIRLELVRWEKSVLPGIASEPQQVIDRAVGDYDVFLGILWKKFGTPTSDAMSGTEHEFHQAYGKYKVDQTSVRIMIYFSEMPVPPSELDPEQLVRISAFRGTLGEKGILWWTFRSRDEFEQLLRLHLAKVLQESSRKVSAEPGLSPSVISAASSGSTSKGDIGDDEAGILELLYQFQSDATVLQGSTERISSAITDFTSQITARTQALNEANAGGLNLSRVIEITNGTGEDVEAFAKRIETELPIQSTIFERTVRAIARVAMLQSDASNKDSTQFRNSVAAAKLLSENLRRTKTSSEEFRKSISAWPKMTTALRRAQRRAVAALDQLIAQFQRNVDITDEIVRSLERSVG